LQLRAVKFLPAEVRVRIGEDDAAEFVDRRAHLLYPQLMESDLAPDAGEVPAVFVVAQQAPDMQ